MGATRISRREFLGGAAALGLMPALEASAAGLMRGAPRLKFGVLTDLHLRVDRTATPVWSDTRHLERALKRFRELGADAIVIGGDIGNWSWVEELEVFQRAWERVFPVGCGVERVIVSGNHDWNGYRGLKDWKKLVGAPHILSTDMAGNWERILHEKYEIVFKKEIRGYTFIGQHWEQPNFYKSLPAFLERHGAAIGTTKPFFYVQHIHPKDTCYGAKAGCQDRGETTKCLAAYPNAVVFSGHSHYPLTDERSIWQGAFTSIGAGSLSSCFFAEDEFKDRGGIAGKVYDPKIHSGLFVTVYDDAIVYSRHDFEHDVPIGEDWVQPLPACAATNAFDFGKRGGTYGAPRFPSGAKLAVTRTEKGLSLVIPAAEPEARARAYVFEVEVRGAEGAKPYVKMVMAAGYNESERIAAAKAETRFDIPSADLPTGDLKVSVTPVNCFGRRGEALVSLWKGGRR